MCAGVTSVMWACSQHPSDLRHECSGRTYSLRPTEVSYILPGGGYESKDVGAISEAADAACKDDKLMGLAWEVRSQPYTTVLAWPNSIGVHLLHT